MGPTYYPQRPRREPLFDIHQQTGATIEVFYADRSLETFGRSGGGWFWWPRPHGYPPSGPAAGPFPTSYAAYRHAMSSNLGNARVALPMHRGRISRLQHCPTAQCEAKQLLGNGLLYDQFRASRGDNAKKIKLAYDGDSDPKTSS